MDASGHASADVTFFGQGPHVVTASYNGGFGPFHPAEAEPRTITVEGQPLTFGPLFGSATYGGQGRFDVALFTTDTTLPVPTGTIQILRDGIVIGQAGLVADPAGSGLIVVRAQVVLGSAIQPGAHPITIAYTGDATYASKSAEATYNVFKRRPDVVLDPPFPNPATVGEDVVLSGRLVLPAGMPVPPSGTLTLGNSGTSCEIPLVGGALGGSCVVQFDRINPTEVLFARYTGDDRYTDNSSSSRTLPVDASLAIVDVETSFHAGRVWTDSEPVTVTWDVTGSGAADPTGSVSVVTNEGFRTCTATLSGTCQIRFSTPSEAAWVEVRYHGSSAFDPAVGRVSAKVLGCYNVTVSGGGRNTTAPNCAGTKFLSGTPVELVPASRAGYRFLGWTSDIDGLPYVPSPVYIRKHRYIEPRYEPICMTLRVSLRPYGLPRVPPSPAPNCDDLVALDGSIRDLMPSGAGGGQRPAAVPRRHRGPAATFSIRLDVPPDGLVSPVRWSGDGVVSNVVKMDQDREALMELDLPCQQFVADGPPGSTMRVQPSFDRPTASCCRLTPAAAARRPTAPRATSRARPCGSR